MFFFRTLVLSLVFPLVLFAQHLYNSDGSKFNLSISNEYISVRFNDRLTSQQQKNYFYGIDEIDQNRKKIRLSNQFLALPVKENVKLKLFSQKLKNSLYFDAVFTAYMSPV